MPLLTLISRASDGLILCASLEAVDVDGSEELSKKAKAVLKTVTPNSRSPMQFDAGAYYFLYIITNGVAYLSAEERDYPKKLSLAYLEEVRREYEMQYGREVSKAQRVYEHIKFDNFLQKTKKLYDDTNSQRNLSKVTEELQDVQRIMTQSIEELLGRGEKMNKIETRSSALAAESKKYHASAKKLASQLWWRTYGPFIGAGFLILFFLFIRFYFY